MNTSRNVAALGCIAAAAMAAPASFAQDAGWYAGGSIGRSAASIDNDRITRGLAGQGLATAALSDDDRDTAYKLFGGYQLNRNFGVEAGWFDLGRMGYTATTSPAGTLAGDAKFNGLNLDLVGTLPLTDRLSALARVGAAYVHTRGSFASTGAVLMPYPGTGTSAHRVGLKFGAGLAWRVNDAWELRAEAERYRVNDSVGNKGDVDLLSVGLVYRFGGGTPVRQAAAPAPVPTYTAPAPPPPAPAPAPAPAPEPVAAAPVVVHLSADALFGFDQSTLRADGIRELEALAQDLRNVQYDEIRVIGHTDRLGSAAYNEDLSRRRAAAVAAFLVQAGVPANRIASSGVGETAPVTAPGDCRGMAATPALIACLQPDRRVDVQVEGMHRDTP